MQAKLMLTDWIEIVQKMLCGDGGMHGHQVKTMATLSFGWLRAGSPFPIQWGTQLPTETKPASTRRRTERFVANDRISLEEFQRLWIAAILQKWLSPRAEVLLILDETSGHKDKFRRMQLSLAYCGRAIPLTWRCTQGKPQGMRMPQMVLEMLKEVLPHLPGECTVTFLADRGLAWPEVLEEIQSWDWNYVVRLQGSTRTIDEDGAELSARQRVTKPGDTWTGKVDAFKKHGWIEGNLTAMWAIECEEPWLLFGPGEGGFARVGDYAKRMWIEEEFRDDKSQGLDWQSSHITDPERAERLLILVALATVLAVSLGAWGHQTNQRETIDPRKGHWRYSLFQLGRLLLQWWSQQEQNQHGRMRRLYRFDTGKYEKEQPNKTAFP